MYPGKLLYRWITNQGNLFCFIKRFDILGNKKTQLVKYRRKNTDYNPAQYLYDEEKNYRADIQPANWRNDPLNWSQHWVHNAVNK
jgi:hypothetical protein